MGKYWKRCLGSVLAVSLLMGCGSQRESDSGAEQLTQNIASAQSEPDEEGNITAISDRQEEQEQEWNREKDDSYEALQQFSQQLMLENMEKVNPVLSPVSAYLAMGMAGMGAEGKTKQEFMEVMGNNMPAVSQKLMEQYSQEQEGLILSIANSAWVDQQLTPAGQWISDIEEIFRGEGYRGVLSSEQVMEQINSWCSENTRGLIPEMLAEPLSVDARLALFDAVYFKGDWRIPFDALATAERPFTREDGSEVQTETMSMNGANQQYIHSELGEGVILPYQGEEFAYVAILPSEGTSVRQLYRQLTPEALAELLDSKNTELCDLHLPKYEIRFDQKLNDSLMAMGLKRAFDGDLAELSGLGKTEQGNPLYISLVRQKAVFRVDEKGTEAAAVTMAVVNECTSIRMDVPRQLYFDRPFVYMILDQKTQVPLFTGIMDDPTGELTELLEQPQGAGEERPEGADHAGTPDGREEIGSGANDREESVPEWQSVMLPTQESDYEAVRDFSHKLMTESLEAENPVLSPLSAYLALSMAAAGAQGETAEELEELLGADHERLSEELLKLAGEKEKLELTLADSVWMDENLEAEDAWIKQIQGEYQGELYHTDLDSQQTMEEINAWAEEHTQGLVKEFLNEPLSQETRLCLLNALYLKAEWQSIFEGYATREQTWYCQDGTEKQVDTMHKGAVHFDYLSGEGMDGVVLPFQGEELVFVALRPTQGQSARELYGELTPQQLAGLLDKREERLMQVALPKFTAVCDQELDEMLRRLGVKRAFDGKLADFSGIGTDKDGMPLYIGLVRQKAVVDLNEEGVKAGAVTEIEMRAGSAMMTEEPIEMTLDHPFVYMILDLESQVPLFVGIMDDPS